MKNLSGEKEYVRMKYNIYKLLALTILIQKLNLFKEDKTMVDENMNSQNFVDLFKSPDKKFCILLGAVTRQLIRIQYTKMGSTPFLRNIIHMKCSRQNMIKLIGLIRKKFWDYDMNFPTKLEEKLVYYTALTEDNWTITDDEAKAYYVIGYDKEKEINNELKGEIKNE